MNSPQPADNGDAGNEQSNGFSSTSFLNEFVHRQSVKKPNSKGPEIALQQKLKNFSYQLFNSLSILTPSRLKPLQLRKQLRNYQFEKVQRKIESESLQKFGKAEQQLFKEQQNLILILTSIMRQFRSSKDHQFYILTKKSARVFHFCHRVDQKSQNIESTLTICNATQGMKQQLDSQKIKIPFEKVQNENCQKIIIKNQAISIFWGMVVNKIIQNQKHFKSFYIIANFVFPNGSEVFPTELYNGLQSRKQYSYIAKPSINILGQSIEEVYRMKITGIWTLQNIKNVVESLTEQFGQKCFDIQFETDKVTEYLKSEENEESMGFKKGA